MGFRTFPTASIELKTWPEIAEAPSVKRPLGELALKRLPTSRFRNDAAILCTECPSTIFVTAVKRAKFQKVSRTQGIVQLSEPAGIQHRMPRHVPVSVRSPGGFSWGTRTCLRSTIAPQPLRVARPV